MPVFCDRSLSLVADDEDAGGGFDEAAELRAVSASPEHVGDVPLVDIPLAIDNTLCSRVSNPNGFGRSLSDAYPKD